MMTITNWGALAIALISTHRLCAQSIAPHWEGVMLQQGAPLPISLDFTGSDTALTATWSAPSMRALRIPLQRARVTGARVHFELVGDQSSTIFDGETRGDSLLGRFAGGEGEGTFVLVSRAVPPRTYREEEVRFSNGPVTLAGTLLIPLSPGRHRAVVFVHGSGPESDSPPAFSRSIWLTTGSRRSSSISGVWASRAAIGAGPRSRIWRMMR